jgi:hypothetical protein
MVEDKSEKKGTVVEIEPVAAVVTPYGMAKTSHDMFLMADAHPVEESVPLAQYYVFCASIEIGLKAAILGNDCTSGNKKAIKGFRHDLCKVHEAFKKTYASPWDEDDLKSISAINPYFSKKGLEYFTMDVIAALLKGFKEIPDINSIREAARKVNDFLKSKNFFIDATTSEKPTRGAIAFF